MRLMRTALKGRFKKTKIRLDMPCIVLSFSEYTFEVVPVVTFSDDEDLHRVPGSGARDWVKCYPNVPTKWMTRCNYANDGKFIPLIKILKNWNRNNNVSFKSFHLELLTEMVFREVSEIWSYPQGIYEWMSCVSKKKSPLPTLATARKPAVPLPNLKSTTPFPIPLPKPFTLGNFLDQAVNRNALGSHFNKPTFPPRKEQHSNFLTELLRSYPKKPGR